MRMEPYFRLTVLTEYMRGTTFELTGEVHACGRNRKDCAITINDPSVSGLHCNFVKRVASYYVIDLGSTNGTRVDNVPIVVETRLKSGDIVTVGAVEMMYQSNEKATQKNSVIDRTGIDLGKYDPTDTIVTQTMNVSGMGNLDPFHRIEKRPLLARRLTQTVIATLVALIIALTAYLVYCVKTPVQQHQSPVSALKR